MIKDVDIENALDFIRDNAVLIGQLRGQKAYLEHHIKVCKAQAFLNASGTVAEREAVAQVNKDVQEKIKEYHDCVTELETLVTYCKAADLKIEVWRSQSANQRRGNVG